MSGDNNPFVWFDYGGKTNPTVHEMAVMKQHANQLDVMFASIENTEPKHPYRWPKGRIYERSSTFHHNDYFAVGNLEGRPYWNKVVTISPNRLWSTEAMARQIAKYLMMVLPDEPPSHSIIYRQVWKSLQQIEEIQRDGNYQDWASLGDVMLPTPAKLEALRIYGSAGGGFGEFPRPIVKLLNATGLQWQCVDPRDRKMPTFWQQYYMHFIKDKDNDDEATDPQDKELFENKKAAFWGHQGLECVDQSDEFGQVESEEVEDAQVDHEESLHKFVQQSIKEGLDEFAGSEELATKVSNIAESICKNKIAINGPTVGFRQLVAEALRELMLSEELADKIRGVVNDVDDGHTNEALAARVQFLQQENNTLTRKNRELTQRAQEVEMKLESLGAKLENLDEIIASKVNEALKVSAVVQTPTLARTAISRAASTLQPTSMRNRTSQLSPVSGNANKPSENMEKSSWGFTPAKRAAPANTDFEEVGDSPQGLANKRRMRKK
ncbi:hypothetical protein KJ359_011004 [Pestalotiopsis sp. 9143b]|nr:hypothetical protein KJ359_011004 [Pestalotiopsis sp. 9143b]